MRLTTCPSPCRRGERGERAQAAIDALEEALSGMEDAESGLNDIKDNLETAKE